MFIFRRRMAFIVIFLAFAGLFDAVSYADIPSSTTGFHNESGAGVVIVGGNAHSASLNLSQLNTYSWEMNLIRFNAKYLRTESEGIDSARYWNLGLRYE